MRIRLVVRMLLVGVLLTRPMATYAAAIPPEWQACEKTTDCDVVSSPCGQSIGINIRYKTEALKEICKTENCSGNCDKSYRQAYAAVCQSNKCTPDYTVEPPPTPQVQFELKELELRCPESNPNCGVIKK